MYNVIIKVALAAGCVASMIGCGPNEIEKQQLDAKEIIDSVKQLENAGKYIEALDVLARVDSLCPKALDERKEAHAMKPALMMNATTQEIAMTDSLMVASEIKADELMKQLAVIKTPYESYYGYAKLKGVSPRTTAGLYAELSLQGLVFHLTASGKGSSYGVKVRVSDRTAREYRETQLVDFDGERNRLTDNGLQIVTLTEAESAPLGAFVSAHRNANLWVSIVTAGGKSWSDTQLSKEQIDGVATLYDIMEQRRIYNECKARLEHLNNKLNVLRNQQAEFADLKP